MIPLTINKKQGLPEPEYQSDGYTVKIIFWKTAQKTTQKTTQKDIDDFLNSRGLSLSANQLSILSQISANPKITRRELESNSGISADGVKYNIARLQELGLLHREGGRKYGVWVVAVKDDK